ARCLQQGRQGRWLGPQELIGTRAPLHVSWRRRCRYRAIRFNATAGPMASAECTLHRCRAWRSARHRSTAYRTRDALDGRFQLTDRHGLDDVIEKPHFAAAPLVLFHSVAAQRDALDSVVVADLLH